MATHGEAAAQQDTASARAAQDHGKALPVEPTEGQGAAKPALALKRGTGAAPETGFDREINCKERIFHCMFDRWSWSGTLFLDVRSVKFLCTSYLPNRFHAPFPHVVSCWLGFLLEFHAWRPLFFWRHCLGNILFGKRFLYHPRLLGARLLQSCIRQQKSPHLTPRHVFRSCMVHGG